MSDLLGSQDIFCPQILAVSGEKRVFQHPLAITLKIPQSNTNLCPIRRNSPTLSTLPMSMKELVS